MSRARVLFLCTGNSARSQIAEALLKHLGGADFEVLSAGTRPTGVDPLTLRVLQERGLDSAGLRSKSLDEFAGQRFDYVVTVCDAAAEECPFFPGAAQQLHWSFPDPAAVEGTEEEKLAAFRETERGMRERVQDFVEAVRKDAGAGRRQSSA